MTIRFLTGIRRHAISLGALALLLGISLRPAQAQLANNFYNVTGIETQVLSNAVQVTIKTDGTVLFGADINDWIETSNNRWEPKPISSFRLRLVQARAKLPAFVNIGAYPIESAGVTLGREPLSNPYFNSGGWSQAEPRVDITFNFFVPVLVQRFDPDYYGINFRSTLSALEVQVAVGSDQRSIVITAIPDRADAGRAANIKRSPTAHHHRLRVERLPSEGEPRLRIDALHSPLAEVVGAVATTGKAALATRSDAADVDVSLHLPDVSSNEFLKTVAFAYGLTITERPPGEGGGYAIGRGTKITTTERLPLRYLTPDKARLLFPDFLLPSLRADTEHNALFVSGSPQLIKRIRADLTRFDLPQPQVRVEATLWEIADPTALQLLINASITRGTTTLSGNGGTGQFSIQLSRDQTRALNVGLQALSAKGHARLMAKPAIVVLSGQSGTLFLGQTRYIKVLQTVAGQQNVQAVSLQVGYSLTVQPRVGAHDDISLDLNPRISTVDAIESGTGLPTLGIREVNSASRVRPDDSVLLAGLEDDETFNNRRRSPLTRLPLIGGIFASRDDQHVRTSLLVLVSARKV